MSDRSARGKAGAHWHGRALSGVLPTVGTLIVVGLLGTVAVPRLLPTGQQWVAYVITASACLLVLAAGWALNLRSKLRMAALAHAESERKRLETVARYQGLQTAIVEGVFLHRQGRVLEANESASSLFGYSQQEFQGMDVRELLASGRSEELPGGIQFESEVFLETEGLRKDGSAFPLAMLQRRVPYEEGMASLLVIRDFTAQKRLEHAITSMAFLDELTALYNRRGFMTVAEQQLKAARRRRSGAALFYVDLDNLKKINDRWGHLEGDAALVAAARILKESFRDSDVVARVGGDEFGVLALECHQDSIGGIVDNLRRRCDRYNATSNRPFELSMSIGTSHYDPARNPSIRELVGAADRAMYEDKKSKRRGALSKGPQQPDAPGG